MWRWPPRSPSFWTFRNSRFSALSFRFRFRFFLQDRPLPLTLFPQKNILIKSGFFPFATEFWEKNNPAPTKKGGDFIATNVKIFGENNPAPTPPGRGGIRAGKMGRNLHRHFGKHGQRRKGKGARRRNGPKPISRSWGGRKAGCGRHSSGKPDFPANAGTSPQPPLSATKGYRPRIGTPPY